ncbi:non-specific serine/threonine protein kinase [Theileria orientalis]|uniref:non-specific serine/threonine protein kinase n=1 Tax=Theileria orientalis TaxID=68886 RepID=A0A976MB25_THEOR|nr:non-specific serine/threonine protein kinase [Theileria orientalis]
MKSGFLLSSDPSVSVLSERPTESDKTLGSRKYKYDDFDFNRAIGTGNFSTVWHVTLKAAPLKSFAIKSYNINDVTSKNQHFFVKQERSALLHLNSPGHKNVIKLVDTFRDPSYVYLIYEFAELELWELIKHCGSIFDDLARYFILQIIDGLEYIHSKGIVHRDLKCENVVISDGTLKIIDFGSSKFHTDSNTPNSQCLSSAAEPTSVDYPDEPTLDSRDLSASDYTGQQDRNLDQSTCSTDARGYRKSRRTRVFENYVGTPNFMDPQAISNRDTGFRRDFWSLGCLIYQILCGRPPFCGSTEYFVLKRVREFDLVFPDCVNSDARDLVKLLLSPQEDQALTFQVIRQHPFFSVNPDSINFKELLHQSSEWRHICYRIGDLLIELTHTRSPETTLEFKHKFDEYIRSLKDAAKNSNMHVMDRLVDLMFWSLEQTKLEIVNETSEADRWLS